MPRLLAAVLVGPVSVGMTVGVGAGVAAADSSNRGHSHSHRVHRNVGSGVDTEGQDILPPHLENLKNDPLGRKKLLDLLQNSVAR